MSISSQDLGSPNVSLSSVPHVVVSTLLYVAGAISVVMIIISALLYVTSAGDPKRTASAKSTLVYAIVGLVIVVAAGGILKFILHSF